MRRRTEETCNYTYCVYTQKWPGERERVIGEDVDGEGMCDRGRGGFASRPACAPADEGGGVCGIKQFSCRFLPSRPVRTLLAVYTTRLHIALSVHDHEHQKFGPVKSISRLRHLLIVLRRSCYDARRVHYSR